jgi:enoyl-CoA hydratase/carnithine racemase
MASSEVTLEWDGRVAIITIDRPHARNAIARDTMEALTDVLNELRSSPAHVVVLTGGGDRVFVSGGDLKDLAAVRTHESATAMARQMRGVLDQLATLAVPVIAAVNGDAYGGGAEVAVACDIRVAAEDVNCAFNQIALGIMPAWGGVERLSGLVGRGPALLLMTTGRVLPADMAFRIGLFDEVVPRERFERHWRELAAQMARAPRDALVGIKAAQQAAFPAVRADLAEAAIESFARTWVADEHWELMEAAETRRRAARSQA